jgi:20S proteasome alpha/beta subunit
MTLIVGVRCQDGVVLAADRRRTSKYEKGPSTTKLFQLSCGVALAGAGDDAVLNEARILVDRRLRECRDEPPISSLFDVVEIVADIVNDLVGRYQNVIEEPFGFVLSGLDYLNSGIATMYTVMGAGLLEVPWACLGLGSSYARPLLDLLLAKGDLSTRESAKVIPVIFTMVSNVQTTVSGDVDIYIINDEQVIGEIKHEGELSLSVFRKAILNVLDIEA